MGKGQKDDREEYRFRRKYLWPKKISWHNAYSFGGPPPKISKRRTGPVWVGGWVALIDSDQRHRAGLMESRWMLTSKGQRLVTSKMWFYPGSENCIKCL